MFKAASGYWRCISWTLGSWKVGKPSSLQGVLYYIISFMILAWLSGGNFVKLILIISTWHCWLIQGFLWRWAACIWRRCWWSLTLRVGQWSACFCSSTWIVYRESIPWQSADILGTLLQFSCLWNLHMNVNQAVNPVRRSWVCALLFRRRLCSEFQLVWTHFPLLTVQPLPLASLLVDDMLLCFGNIFASQVIYQQNDPPVPLCS